MRFLALTFDAAGICQRSWVSSKPWPGPSPK
jgi:hypothetical protein